MSTAVDSATKPGRNENSQTANVKQQTANMGLLLRYHIKYQDNFLMPKQDNVRLVVQTKPVVLSQCDKVFSSPTRDQVWQS